MGSYDGQMDALHCALRRKQDLLQRLREQHLLEDLNRPHTWGGSRKQYQSHFAAAPQLPLSLPYMGPIHIQQPAPALLTLPPPPPAPPQPPRIIQQALPQQPATIIQQLPHQQLLITQIPPLQPNPVSRSSSSIKEDMVELMLMQNAQMHQIIMHNMIQKAMPPMALSPPGGPNHSAPRATYLGQDGYQGTPIFVRPDVKPGGSAVHHHHHHHYGPTPAALHLPPISYHTWLPGVSPVPAGQAQGHLPLLHHGTVPFTLPPLNV
ncbi:uncharacterized protein C21orf58 [Scomber scombrus]|uniref:uncharacterized protein C21orf58 n=1 Tax=Scomber scombrus TaxID=13677 RepID=UPI002DD81B01|nr:uncharacterized protein C21orf58 [Scomber scombrus]